MAKTEIDYSAEGGEKGSQIPCPTCKSPSVCKALGACVQKAAATMAEAGGESPKPKAGQVTGKPAGY